MTVIIFFQVIESAALWSAWRTCLRLYSDLNCGSMTCVDKVQARWATV